MKSFAYSCREGFANAPECGDIDKTNIKRCPAGLFCIQRDDKHYPSCETVDVRDDVNIGMTSFCKFSGQGITNCQLPKGFKCGPQNGGTRCNDGFFCTEQGNCIDKQPPMSQNCRMYSGLGIRDCRRRVSNDKKCGPQNRSLICPANNYCMNGECTLQRPPRPDETCKMYSAENVNCMLDPPAGARTISVMVPVPVPAPARAPAVTNANFRTFPDKKWDINLTRVTSSANKVPTSQACMDACDTNRACTAFYYKPQDCTQYMTNFPTINQTTNINNYSSAQAGSMIGYRIQRTN